MEAMAKSMLAEESQLCEIGDVPLWALALALGLWVLDPGFLGHSAAKKWDSPTF